MASSTTEFDVSRFQAKSSGLVREGQAIALLEAMAALERYPLLRNFEMLKKTNAQCPSSKLKATYAECVGNPSHVKKTARGSDSELSLPN